MLGGPAGVFLSPAVFLAGPVVVAGPMLIVPTRPTRFGGQF